jgi:hypothetical protein
MKLKGHLIAGSMIASSKSVDNSLNPAWRDTAVHMIVKASWDENVPAAAERAIHDRFTNKIAYAMRSVSPDSGCYINEVRSNQPTCYLPPCLTDCSVTVTSQTGKAPCTDPTTPDSKLSRPSTIPKLLFGAESASAATSGSTMLRRVAFARVA